MEKWGVLELALLLLLLFVGMAGFIIIRKLELEMIAPV